MGIMYLGYEDDIMGVDANQVLKQIEKMSEITFLPIIGSQKGKVLIKVIRRYKPKRILEIGTLIGYSAILMGKELNKDSELITIEINPKKAKISRQNIKKAGIKPKVKVIVGNAVDLIPKLKGKFDMVFIDADKIEYKTNIFPKFFSLFFGVNDKCMKYLKLAEPKLHKDSIIVVDNAGKFAKEIKDYLDYVRNSGNYESKYIAVGNDGVEISIKNRGEEV